MVMREGTIAAILNADQISEDAIVANAIPKSKGPVPVAKPLRPCDDRYRNPHPQNSPLQSARCWTFLGLVLIFAVFAVLNPVFLTAPNLINILQQSSINACIALGMTFVIISGGIDLSVGPPPPCRPSSAPRS